MINQLTGIRAILAWWVVGLHILCNPQMVKYFWFAPLFSRGNLAVDGFFVLSGFLITRILLHDRRSHIPGAPDCADGVPAGVGCQPHVPPSERCDQLLGSGSGAESSHGASVGFYRSSGVEQRGMVYQRGVVCIPALSGLPDRGRQG